MDDNPVIVFQEAMDAAGIHLAAGQSIASDGKLHRARASDDKAGARSIWYNLHLDQPASGAAGNWKTGATVRWCSKRQSTLTAKERETLRLRIEADKQRAEREQAARHADAARRAAWVWDHAKPASPQHPYLLKKQVPVGIGRQKDGLLILPIFDFGGTLHGLQYIDGRGAKRFSSGMGKRGHFIPTGEIPDGTAPLYIAEGYATAATLAAMKPNACHIAGLDCGNLINVATAARERWPRLQIVVCPDFDAVGQSKGRAAAEVSVLSQIDGALVKFFEGSPGECCSTFFHYHS
ncbi:toprim domain-containing protein [Acidithiobacillus sp. M4-SHS-6]|uniref:toprim domain-containing protein n=1 Tax=Acidithiobacillus sp. M4-SHS-6 TaxID=3383024 RepID=UPI0039BE2506